MRLLLAIATLGAALPLGAQQVAGPPVVCSATVPAVPTVRPEGKTELVGDVVITCTGGSPTINGNVIPTSDVTLVFDTQVTSQAIGGGRSEGLLLLDEPPNDAQFPCTQSKCTVFGNGEGGGYYGPYNPQLQQFGVPNVYDSAVSANTITWSSIPFDPPGGEFRRIFRFTNVRLDATKAIGGALRLVGVSLSGFTLVLDGTPTVATVQSGLSPSVRDATSAAAAANGVAVTLAAAGSSSTRAATLRFTSQLPSAVRTRTVASSSSPDAAADPVAQDQPGGFYNSESGFYNPTFPTTTPGAVLSTAGLAGWGTRLMATFSNVPSNVTIYVSLKNDGAGIINAPAARLITTAADGSGAFSAVAGNGAFAQLTPSNGTATAVWEVLATGSNPSNNFDFAVYLAYNAQITTSPSPITVKLGYAPLAGGAPVFSGAINAQTLFSFTATAVPPPPPAPPPPPPPAILTVSPATLTFTATVGGQNPPAQSVIVNSSPGPVAYSQTGGGVIPFVFQPPSGTTNNTTTVSVNIRGLLAGTYQDTVTFLAPQSQATVAVTLVVTARPIVTALTPPSAVAGTPAFTLTVSGANFLRGTTVLWNGGPLPTTFVSSTSLTASVSAGLIAQAGEASVSVVTPDGSLSNAVAFPIIPFTLTSIAPVTIPAGSPAFTIRATGSGFLSGATLNVGGAILQPADLTSSQITATVPATVVAQPGGVRVVVVNPSGLTSNALTLTVTEPLILSSIAPNTRTATGPGFSMTLTGSGFATGATVQIGSTTLTPTSAGRTSLSVSVPAASIAEAGNVPVRVVNSPAEVSNAVTLTVTPAPRLTSLAPAAVNAGAGGPLSVSGTNLQGCTIFWNGQPQVTTGVSSNELRAQLSQALTASAGTATVTAVTGDGVMSNALTFTINGPITLTALSPATVNAGSGAFTLTVTGSNIPPGATVMAGGQPVPTTVASSSQATAQIPASLTGAVGTTQITMASVEGAVSNALTLVVVLPSLPNVGLTGPSTSSSGQDQTITLTLGGTYPVDLTVTLTLTFTPDTGLPDDPAVQFQNGTRTLTFTIPAGSPLQIPPVLAKTGTVAGTITVTVTLTAATGENVTPPSVGPIRINVGRLTPGISSMTCSRNASGFTVVIDGYTNTREATQATFDFTAASGASLGTTQLVVQTAPLFSSWFGSSSGSIAGGVFRYTQPFTVQGTATNIAGVAVRLGNAVGASSSSSCQLQ